MNEFLDHAITVRDLFLVAGIGISLLSAFFLTLRALRLRPDKPNRPPVPTTGSGVRPITEGYICKGGQNHGPSQITTRPPPPGPMRKR